ncbi:hypothetical protein TrLO_g13673 [Triparma laevis f. longispina]|uniref:Uncharacterized protein n=1 Tax=Triparma laevis f. longispina TaxID=1714387 RepID=A0A9W6ZPL8_9STRA|nr:hypothetical protein TrLO_g13673 [Triparma laevis f. longispina]
MSQHEPSAFEMSLQSSHVILDSDDSDSDDDGAMGASDDMINSATEQLLSVLLVLSPFQFSRELSRPISPAKIGTERLCYPGCCDAGNNNLPCFCLGILPLHLPPPSTPTPATVESLKSRSYLPPDRRNGVVASDDALCSEIGTAIMRDHSG